MLIEKQFSNIDREEERVYSVLMDEEELRLYSEYLEEREYARAISNEDYIKEIIKREKPDARISVGSREELGDKAIIPFKEFLEKNSDKKHILDRYAGDVVRLKDGKYISKDDLYDFGISTKDGRGMIDIDTIVNRNGKGKQLVPDGNLVRRTSKVKNPDLPVVVPKSSDSNPPKNKKGLNKGGKIALGVAGGLALAGTGTALYLHHKKKKDKKDKNKKEQD